MRRQQNAQNGEKNMEVSQCESKTMESSWVQMNDKRNFQERRKEKQKLYAERFKKR